MRSDPRVPYRAFLRTAVAVAGFALTAGCADLLGPATAPAVFALQSLDDRALPALIGEPGPFSASFLDADSLVISASGLATWVRHARLELDAGGPILSRVESTVVLVRSGSAFSVAAPGPCSVVPSCVDLTVVRLEQLPDELVIAGSEGTRRYVRVPSAR